MNGAIFSIAEFKKYTKEKPAFDKEKMKEFLSNIRKTKTRQIVLDRFEKAVAFNPVKEEIFLTKK